MKTLYSNIVLISSRRVALTLLVFFGLISQSFGQPPFLIQPYPNTELDDTVIIHMFGLFMTDPIDIKVGSSCSGTYLNTAEYASSDFEIFFSVPRTCGPLTDVVSITTAQGTGVSQFTVTIPGPSFCSLPTEANSTPDFVVRQENSIFTTFELINKFTLTVNSAPFNYEKGKFIWELPNPVSSISTVQFSNPSNNIASIIMVWGSSGEVLSQALASIGYTVIVTNVTVEDTGPTTKYTYDLTFVAPLPANTYPRFIGSGVSWVQDLDGGTNTYPEGSYKLALGGRVADFTLQDTDLDIRNKLYQCRDYDYSPIVTRDYTQNYSWSIELNNNLGYYGPNSPFVVHSNALTYLGDPLDITLTQTQTYVKDFGENPGSTQNYNLLNVGLTELQLAATPVTITGTNAADFSVTQQPSSTIAKDGSTSFTIQFNPTSGQGEKTATVEVASLSSQKIAYSFAIKGTAPLANAEITVSESSLVGFSSSYSSTEGSSQLLTVNSTGLTSDLSVSANANFEVSKDNSAFSRVIAFTSAEANGSAQNVYVRLSDAACESANVSGKVTFSSTGADTKETTLSGAVSSGSALNTLLSFVRNSASSVTINWLNPTGNARNFDILRADNDICAEYTVLAGGSNILPNATTFTDNTVENGKNYYYKVRYTP